ncbi:dihydrolipoamide acetyltransferase family protein [Peloplasma aerotolerans]|uniref:Dihydrolipoamide acetyltransferase component of pyruvate dehydrogenase complex n=1 Tax=Peloplasma aerotolerans TaxID=3044389 RepID=A0AAW6UCV2_9MOLU|nr:dihydrolipoamide acetyltransferase family protein [Mariniplasma sp. M4Ah]MDI6452803.1 dihydrolipoamide acetyltransferase family protein [Mariniplasma sp. M4Ah]
MATPVLMPKQGITVESCFLSEWHVKENDVIEIGTVLFSYETDKAVFDYTSEVEGVVIKILYEQGEIVNVLEPVCYVGKPGEKVEVEIESEPKDKPKIVEDVKDEIVNSKDVNHSNLNTSQNVFASPRAKGKANKQNIDIKSLRGTGPNGRIIERDVSYSNRMSSDLQTDNEQKFDIKPLSNMRKLIGKAMMNSLQNTAQLTHTLSFDATDIINYRKLLKLKEKEESLPKITLNDIIVYSVSRVLKSHMDLNAHFDNQELKVFNHMHIGIATDTKRGLMVPTLFNADTLSLSQMSIQAKSLINDCLAGSINPDLLSGASFTISNLGTLDIEHFTPIINPPQTGILGVNTITTQVKKDEYGRIVFFEAMGLSLTYDHQVIDGAGASRFLKELKEYLQDFTKNIESDPYGLR